MTSLIVKAPPKEPATAPIVLEATAEDYSSLLVRSRKEQLRLTRANLQRLAEIYDRAAQSIVEKVRALPDDSRVGAAWAQAQFQLLRDVDEQLTALRRDFADTLDLSLLSTAQQAADRESEVAKLVEAPADRALLPNLSTTRTLTTGLDLTVRHGTLAQSAVEATANRYYRDGLKLSDRLYNLDDGTRKTVEDTIVQGLAEQLSARDLATRLQAAMAEAGRETPRYQAIRIARTEINNAHRESSVRATVNPQTGALKSYIAGVRWNLSLSHPEPDICDVWAAGNSTDLPQGVYQPGEVPVDHPHGLCLRAGHVITGPETIAATARWFDGEIVEIVTASGSFLSVTPNHPVLTPDGWIGAGRLHEGGYVVSALDAERATRCVCPDDYQVPTPIEDIFASLGRSKGVTTSRVPTTSVDFHGDGFNSEVCVIRSDSLLSNRRITVILQPDLEKLFMSRYAELPEFARKGTLALFLKCHAPFLSMFEALAGTGSGIGIHEGLAQSDALRHAPDRNTSLSQHSRQGRPRASDFFGKRLEALSGLVTADKIVGVRKFKWSGHVYNLHTMNGYYIAHYTQNSMGYDIAHKGGVIVHNCYVTSELVAFPGVGGSGKDPDVSSVPRSQIEYYARLGDGPAMALVAGVT